MNITRPKLKQIRPKNAKKVFQGIVFDVYQWQQKQFDNSFEKFEQLKRRDSVGVIAVTKDKKIVITKQTQPGMNEFYGLLGGVVDSGEDIFSAAKRELKEESGFKAKSFGFISAEQLFGKIDWISYYLIAYDCQKVAEPNLDSGEKIELLYLNFEEFMKIIYTDKFRDSELALRILRKKENKREWGEFRKLFF